MRAFNNYLMEKVNAMKDSMIEMMITLMPYMKPFMYFGVAFVVLGSVLVLVKLLFKSNVNKGIEWSMRIVFITALFFIMAQAAGFFLSMPPTINFGDSSKFEFILVAFWQIGAGFLVVGVLLKLLGSIKNQPVL